MTSIHVNSMLKAQICTYVIAMTLCVILSFLKAVKELLIRFWVGLQNQSLGKWNCKAQCFRFYLPYTVTSMWNTGHCLLQKLKGGKVPWDKYDRNPSYSASLLITSIGNLQIPQSTMINNWFKNL